MRWHDDHVHHHWVRRRSRHRSSLSFTTWYELVWDIGLAALEPCHIKRQAPCSSSMQTSLWPHVGALRLAWYGHAKQAQAIDGIRTRVHVWCCCAGAFCHVFSMPILISFSCIIVRVHWFVLIYVRGRCNADVLQQWCSRREKEYQTQWSKRVLF